MTDTNQASELYELCKEVYKRTGWEQRANISELYEYWDDYDELCVISVEDTDDELTPAYNSDYLLEKLPKTLKHHEHYDYLTLWSDSETDWNAAYELDNDCENFDIAGDTPLEALLKLTLALHKENLL
jgi:hypothetical protein